MIVLGRLGRREERTEVERVGPRPPRTGGRMGLGVERVLETARWRRRGSVSRRLLRLVAVVGSRALELWSD